MARRWFEVSYLIFTFCCTKDLEVKTEFVSKEIEKYLKKYASNTSYKVSGDIKKGYDIDTVVKVEFSKKISLNTVNKILIHMLGERIEQLIYTPSDELVSIAVLR